MDLVVKRITRTETSTIGELYVNGILQGYTLEDVDRGLHRTMSFDEMRAIKVKGKTAIPTGQYKVTKYNSPTRGWCLLLHDVPVFDMIEIHVGNYATDSDGCILVGTGVAKDMVTNSKEAIKKLYGIVFPILDLGKDVWITIV